MSERAAAQGVTRSIPWTDRLRLAPTRIGTAANFHFGWRRGSVLNRLFETTPDASTALLGAARAARAAFGAEAGKELSETLTLVQQTARNLGVPISGDVKAMLDAESVSFSGGTISLHDEIGVPMRGLGIGSARLLIAGLQRAATNISTIVLVDELEHGLEPHRIIRFLTSLGTKVSPPPLQAFMTTHSPTALRELSGAQLYVTRPGDHRHDIRNVGTDDDTQGTIRLNPEAFLAHSVIVCEGASEVGFVRGIDRARIANGSPGIGALGVSLLDAGGGGNTLLRANALLSLGYKVSILRDDDVATPDDERVFTDAGGTVLTWRPQRALEDELFISLPTEAVIGLVERAIDLHGADVIDRHILASDATVGPTDQLLADALATGFTARTRERLGQAARTRKSGWFKQLRWMEDVAYDVVAPALDTGEPGFLACVDAIFAWCERARQ